MHNHRFLTDGMLGKLARWLRLLGQEVYYANQIEDEDLLNKAFNQKYVLLTSDVALHRKALSKDIESVLVTGKNEPARIAELASRFQIPLKVNPDDSRCPRCGSPLKRVEKLEVKGKVPEKSFEKHDEYWVCLDEACKKIYWRGSHWKNIEKTLEKASTIINKRENQHDQETV